MRVSLLALAAAAAVLLVLRSGGDPPEAAPPTGTSPCTKAQTKQALASFLGAYRRGAVESAAARFAREPEFQWYSSQAPGRRLGAKAKDRASLNGYLSRRFDRGDRMRLTAFHFTGNSRGWSNFYFDSKRRADGFRGGRWYPTGGKGAAICDGGEARFIVMSLGGPLPAAR